MCGTNCNDEAAWCDDDRCLKQATCPSDPDYQPYVPVFTILKQMYDEEKECRQGRRPWRVLTTAFDDDYESDDDDEEDPQDDGQRSVAANDNIDEPEPDQEQEPDEEGGQRS